VARITEEIKGMEMTQLSRKIMPTTEKGWFRPKGDGEEGD
jgi:hypothetical protein